jgi:hypothetical protein
MTTVTVRLQGGPADGAIRDLTQRGRAGRYAAGPLAPDATKRGTGAR